MPKRRSVRGSVQREEVCLGNECVFAQVPGTCGLKIIADGKGRPLNGKRKFRLAPAELAQLSAEERERLCSENWEPEKPFNRYTLGVQKESA